MITEYLVSFNSGSCGDDTVCNRKEVQAQGDGNEQPDGRRPLKITLYSFGFKHGYPEADMVWDVRFLPNPYWVEDLKDSTGREPATAAYVLANRVGREFLSRLESILRFLVEQYRAGGRPDLRLAIGCTGGRHRSVAVTEHLRRFFDGLPVDLRVFHRDIERS